MNMEIENKFFRMFGTSGVAVLGMEHLGYKYGIRDNIESMPDKLKAYYMEIVPNTLKEQTEAFDDSMFLAIDGERPTLTTEIENNLDECIDENKRERYVFDLLTPFAKWTTYFRPLAEHPFSKRYNAHECDQFLDILGKAEKGTAEWHCKLWHRLTTEYADMVHSILLKYGIDFYQVQKDCDVYLKDERFDVLPDGYFDSPRLAQYYADKQPKQPEPQRELKDLLPEKLKTDEAIEVFQRAVEANLIEIMPNVLKWNETNALLAYLCGKLYCGDTIEIDPTTKEYKIKRGETFLPEEPLNSLFGVKNLGQSRRQIIRALGLPEGHERVDELFR